MNSFSDTISTRPHMRPSPTKLSTPTTYSTKTLNTLFQYVPLSTTSCSPWIQYAPLSSTTSPAFIYRPTPMTTSTNIASSSSETAELNLSAHADCQTTDTPIGFAIFLLILLGMMLAMATMMWLAESKSLQKWQRSEYQERSILDKQRTDAEPVGLGITLHPAVEERREVGDYERLKNWLSVAVEQGKSAGMTGGWNDFAVSRTRTDLYMNAEEGLLLAVRESERSESGKDQIDIELDADWGY
ncbi:uncharacterized protein M437DRAFT_54613 [Aureobasidium melanogenum CBS 110374]|uniref:Uncharacterized protein n=1 Tax=Aureobasidium melanogenum (strain CBS 110374) TaxID=1043003 RepID=A0A074WD16_AURM1|nr:uncharacterized protein M437DRAFT_54613 [Aureobasidium melanogenum CBS 110374]KEQ60381.1 hypothetical protein M437DRAFT_54613 [Aureobasidium melanogenum CBS 110374]